MKVLPRGDWQPVEGVLQVLPGIDAEFLSGLGEAGQDRQGPSAPVRAEEQPVFPPDREGLHRPLRRVVVDRAVAVGGCPLNEPVPNAHFRRWRSDGPFVFCFSALGPGGSRGHG